MYRIYAVVFGVVAVITGLVIFAPSDVNPVSWDAPKNVGYTGAHSPNKALANLNRFNLQGERGPEFILVEPNSGYLYVAVEGGKIIRIREDGGDLSVFANTGGRVLGMDFDNNGNIIAADIYRGLLSISPSGSITLLADRINELDLIKFADAVVVGSNQKVYFTDASTRFAPVDWGGAFEASLLDIMEQSSTGRLLSYDLRDRTVELLVEGFSFANGITLSADEQYVYVVESGKFRVWKLHVETKNQQLSNLKSGILIENLPGFPDNLTRGLEGKIWLGLAKPRSSLLDCLWGLPRIRKMIMSFPKWLWPLPALYGHVIAFDESGNVLFDMQDPEGSYPETTGVSETRERLFIQSLHAPTIGWIANPTLTGNE